MKKVASVYDREVVPALGGFARKLGLRFKRMIRYEQDLRIPVPCPKAKIPLVFRELEEKDLPLCAPLVGAERLPEFRDRLRQGQFAVGALHEGRLAAFTWLLPDEAREVSTGLRFPLKAGEIYSYHKWVDPAYRNLRVGAQLDWERNRIVAAKGYLKKISFVDYRNHASHRSTAKAGSVAAGCLYFAEIFGLKFKWSRPWKKGKVSPRIGF